MIFPLVLAKSRVEIGCLKSILILGPQKICLNLLNILVKHCFECYDGNGCRFKKYFTNYQCKNSLSIGYLKCS